MDQPQLRRRTKRIKAVLNYTKPTMTTLYSQTQLSDTELLDFVDAIVRWTPSIGNATEADVAAALSFHTLTARARFTSHSERLQELSQRAYEQLSQYLDTQLYGEK